MLRSIKSLRKLKIHADDGDIGKVTDFYFDDVNWKVRYIVVDTGKWLFERKVLISPASFLDADWSRQILTVSLTKEQIENSPHIDKDKPVSRQKEVDLAAYYSWPTYWPIGETGVPLNEAAIARTLQAQKDHTSEADEHLRSTDEVIGYTIQATDGELGAVDDFIVDEDDWIIRYFIIDTRKLLPGEKIMLSPMWIEQFNWSTRTCHVDLDIKTIKNGPTFNPNEPVNREVEEHLYDYYGRPQYWSQS